MRARVVLAALAFLVALTTTPFYRVSEAGESFEAIQPPDTSKVTDAADSVELTEAAEILVSEERADNSGAIETTFKVTESDAEPSRLNFVNAIDANVYTERLVYEVFNRLGIEVSVTLSEIDAALKGVNAGVYDGICNQSEQVEELYDQMVAVPLRTATVKYCAITLQEDTAFYGAWEDLREKRVGCLTGKTLTVSNLPDNITSLTEYSCMTTLYNALRDGECDVIVMSDTSDKPIDQLVVPSFARVAGLLSSDPCHIYLSSEHASLIGPISKVLQSMEQDGSLEQIKAMKPIKERNEKSVLYLSSYSAEMEWELKLFEGISNVFGLNEGIVFRNIALNTYRNTNTAFLETAALNTITVDFINSPPDAVIVSDNEAMSFLLNNYNTILPNDVPVVACGINNDEVLQSYSFDLYPNFIGIAESISAALTVDEMLRLFPATEMIYVINDYSLTGRRWQSEIQKQLEGYQDLVEVRYNENLSYEDLITQVSTLNEHTLVLCGSYFLDLNDQYYPQTVVQRGLYNAATVPIFGLLDSSQSYGQLGGRYADAFVQGETAATTVTKVLTQGSVDETSTIDMEQTNRWIFDADIMQEYRIDEHQLPPYAMILNKPLSLHESDPVLFYGIMVGAIASGILIVLLTLFLVALNRRNKKLVVAENDIRTSRDEVTTVKNRLETIIETAPIAFALFIDDHVVESNSYYRETIDVKTGEKNESNDVDHDRFEMTMQECREKGSVKNILRTVSLPDGQTARFLFNLACSEYKGKVSIVTWGVNIEELEQNKDALRRAYQDLEGVIENTPLPISVICPEEKRFVSANPSWRELLRIPDSADIDRLVWGEENLLSAHPMDSLFEEAMSTEGGISREWEVKTFDGEVFEAILYLKKAVFNNKDCLVIAHQDLREEKARERLLQNAAEKELEANRLKSHFLMNMSHEIRTPMNAIIGITQLAKPTDESKKLYESIVQIGQSTAVLLNIVNDVLDLSLIEDGKMELKPKEARLSQVIEELSAIVAVDAEKKSIAQCVNINGVVHDLVKVDASRLQQVLLSLFSNALKFTEEGGKITLTVTETESFDQKAVFLFSLEDNGIGIEPSIKSRLFKPFEQGDDSITRQYGGAGLGLSLVKNIVELMGGEVWVESEVGEGSTFCFTVEVPVVKTEKEVTTSCPEAKVSSEDSSAETEMDYSALRILLVDDVEINRVIASELLGELGCTTEEAENGWQAVEMVVNAAPGYYDLVFMDVQMPVLDGCSATKEIRALKRPDTSTLPIVALTANVMPDDIKMVMDAGMDGYIGKPIFLDQLIEVLKTHIRS